MIMSEVYDDDVGLDGLDVQQLFAKETLRMKVHFILFTSMLTLGAAKEVRQIHYGRLW